MKTKHYAIFSNDLMSKFSGDSLNQNNWDILRTDEKLTPYSFEKKVEDFEKNCLERTDYEIVAQSIIDVINSNNFNDKRVISMGAGKGILEWYLKRKKPELIVECTDYTEKAIELIKLLFTDVDKAYTFDMINGDYNTISENSLLLFYRVSTEFDQKCWYKIFEKMYNANIEYIIYLPIVDTSKSILKEKKYHLSNIYHKRKDIFCGWLYTENEFLKIFHNKGKKALYTIEQRVTINNNSSDFTPLYLLKKN